MVLVGLGYVVFCLGCCVLWLFVVTDCCSWCAVVVFLGCDLVGFLFCGLLRVALAVGFSVCSFQRGVSFSLVFGLWLFGICCGL